jgi:hypothetical protein
MWPPPSNTPLTTRQEEEAQVTLTHQSFYSCFGKCGSFPCFLPFCTYQPVLWIRVGFNADSDPAVNLIADSDPGSQTSADPDPGQIFRSQKVEILNEKYTSCW